jgi:hypothetical protein
MRLEELIRQRQDQLRGRPKNWRERLRDKIGYPDWSYWTLVVLGSIWVTAYTFLQIASFVAEWHQR